MFTNSHTPSDFESTMVAEQNANNEFSFLNSYLMAAPQRPF